MSNQLKLIKSRFILNIEIEQLKLKSKKSYFDKSKLQDYEERIIQIDKELANVDPNLIDKMNAKFVSEVSEDKEQNAKSDDEDSDYDYYNDESSEDDEDKEDEEIDNDDSLSDDQKDPIDVDDKEIPKSSAKLLYRNTIEEKHILDNRIKWLECKKSPKDNQLLQEYKKQRIQVEIDSKKVFKEEYDDLLEAQRLSHKLVEKLKLSTNFGDRAMVREYSQYSTLLDQEIANIDTIELRTLERRVNDKVSFIYIFN